MDNDSKLLTEQYNKITEELKDTTGKELYQAVVDCYYEIQSLGRRPGVDPDVIKLIQNGLRDILQQLRSLSAKNLL